MFQFLVYAALLATSTAITIHGSQQTRTPLVHWYLHELGTAFKVAPNSPSGHPFGQTPYLVDSTPDGEVEVFESGAILLYLADKLGGLGGPYINAAQRASYTKWVVFSNSELDGLCFGKGMSGTSLDKPNKKLDVLDDLLGSREWLVGNKFSVADVAVGSYLNYVPVFFGNVYPVQRKNLCKYMQRCAARPNFAKAFGKEHADLVITKTKGWIDGSASNPKARTGLW